jgi:hypothetical protein
MRLFEYFFGVSVQGDAICIDLYDVGPEREIAKPERRRSVRARVSGNWRFELNAAKCRDYPDIAEGSLDRGFRAPSAATVPLIGVERVRSGALPAAGTAVMSRELARPQGAWSRAGGVASLSAFEQVRLRIHPFLRRIDARLESGMLLKQVEQVRAAE